MVCSCGGKWWLKMKDQGKVMLEVEQSDTCISIAHSVSTLLHECSAITDYRTLRDSLPKKLAHLLKCRCVLFYQKVGETLQFASGTYDEQPGWSAALLSVVHINPVSLSSDVPEAQAWRLQTAVAFPSLKPTRVAVPLVYRQRCTGVLVAIRSGTDTLANEREKDYGASSWTPDDVPAVTAIADVAALLLGNTRLLERDRERAHTLSLLTTMNSQMTYTLYEVERLRTIMLQRMREIARVDVCDMIAFSSPEEHVSWVTPELCATLLAYFSQQQTSSSPLVIERPGDVKNEHSMNILQCVPTTIKTFFAFPLLGSPPITRQGRSTRKTNSGKRTPETRVLGVVVGGYQQAWKLRSEESTLLQVVVGQASAILENMQLVAEVVEARNEARKLLRRVLEDQRLKALILESIPSGLITIDMQGHITTFNSAAQTILGYQVQEVKGKSLEALVNVPSSSVHEGSHYFLNAASSPLHKDALQDVLSKGEEQSGTLLSSDQSGQELVLAMELQPLCNDAGKQVGALITFTDVTSVHRLEEEKRRLDRLASLGEMAANVAHEVRNPLASIKTSIQMLVDDLADDDVQEAPDTPSRMDLAQESTTVMLKEVERLDTIVRDMLLFAKPRQLHRSSCDVLALSDHVLQLMQKSCTDTQVHVHRVYETVPALWVDSGQIEQVLFNLYTNALQAMPEGGELTIVCRVIVQVAEQRLKHTTEPQQWFMLKVTDTGVGISADSLKQIFQPFFTTKAHGIGLGLPITRRLIEDHGGTLHVESQPGKGTTMTVCLPLLTSGVEEEK